VQRNSEREGEERRNYKNNGEKKLTIMIRERKQINKR
jgi:hypothetical protein